MKRINFLVGVTLALGVALGLLGSQMLSARRLKSGTVLQRTALKSAPGWEAILVQRIVPPGAESGEHTQSGNEIVYIQEGSVDLRGSGQTAVTLKDGEAFTTAAGEVRDVKNASSSAPAKALTSTLQKGARLEDLSVPADRFNAAFHNAVEQKAHQQEGGDEKNHQADDNSDHYFFHRTTRNNPKWAIAPAKWNRRAGFFSQARTSSNFPRRHRAATVPQTGMRPA